MKLFFKILVLQICGLLAHVEANAQVGAHRGNVSDNGKILTPQNITNYIDDRAGESGPSFDYFWVMADGTIAVNRGVRSYRSPVFVFGSLFDLTRGDCDTEVWQNGVQYGKLCLGDAGGQGLDFVEYHGGVVRFYWNE